MKNPKKTDIVIDYAAIEEAMTNVAGRKKRTMVILDEFAEFYIPEGMTRGKSQFSAIKEDFPEIAGGKDNVIYDKAIELIEGKK